MCGGGRKSRNRINLTSSFSLGGAFVGGGGGGVGGSGEAAKSTELTGGGEGGGVLFRGGAVGLCGWEREEKEKPFTKKEGGGDLLCLPNKQSRSGVGFDKREKSMSQGRVP